MTQKQFIKEIAKYVQKYAPQYNIKVCSPIIAQAILESASGTSELAVNANNYFGLKYRPGRCPSASGIYYKVGSEQNADGSYVSSAMQWMKFSNMENGVKGYFDFINIANYKSLKGVTNPETYLKNIKAAGYATSLKYVDNLMAVIKKYNLTPKSQSMQAIGYKEFFPYFNGEQTLIQVKDKIKQNTRHYAKRQITFFKAMPNVLRLNCNNQDNIIEVIKKS